MRQDETKNGAKRPPTTASAALERFTLSADDGFKLAAVRWLPAGQPRAVLQLSHGMSEYAARYAPFAAACAAEGIAVYGHDHRGHGDSIDGNTPRGHYADVDGWKKVTGDLHTANRHVAQTHPGVPVFLFGHSMGSFIGRSYLLKHADSVAGAILSATGWRLSAGNRALELIARREVRKRGARTPSARMHKLVFGSFNLRFRPARTTFDWLSRDPEQVDAYMDDPLCGFNCSAQLWEDLMGAVAELEKLENKPERLARALPILLIAGSHDPVSMGGMGHGQLGERYWLAGNANVSDRRYPGGRHELLNDSNRSQVWSDVLGWIRGHLPAT